MGGLERHDRASGSGGHGEGRGRRGRAAAGGRAGHGAGLAAPGGGSCLRPGQGKSPNEWSGETGIAGAVTPRGAESELHRPKVMLI